MTLPGILPRIDGRKGPIVRAIFWLAFAATLIGVAGSLWFNGRDRFATIPVQVSFGFRTYLTDEGVIVGERAARAAEAGLADGDLIVGVAGVAVPPSAGEHDIAVLLAAAPRATTLTVARAGTRIDARIVRQGDGWGTVDPANAVPVWLFASVSFATLELFPIVLLAAALLLAQRRPRDPEAMLFALAFLGFCWDANVMQWLAALAGWPLETFVLLANLSWCALLIAVAAFPDGRFASRLARIVGVAAGTLALANVPLRLWPALAHRFDTLWVSAVAVVLVAAALALIGRYRRSVPGSTERQQMKWVMMGLTIACLLKLVNLVLQRAPIGHGGLVDFLNDAIVWPAIAVIVPLGLLVSLLRYRLYDAETAISRSAAYALLTLALVAVFTAIEKTVEIVGQEYLGGNLGTVAGGIGAAVMIAPLHARIMHWAEMHFQTHLIRLRRGLPMRADDLRGTATMTELAEAAVARIVADLHAIRSAIVVDTVKIARSGEGETYPVAIDLVAEGIGTQGVLLLGPRPDGSLYGTDERAALADIAAPLARAIAIVRRREVLMAVAAAERQAVLARIATLEAAVTRLRDRDARSQAR